MNMSAAAPSSLLLAVQHGMFQGSGAVWTTTIACLNMRYTVTFETGSAQRDRVISKLPDDMPVWKTLRKAFALRGFVCPYAFISIRQNLYTSFIIT